MEVSRARLARNALRFGVLGAMLLYAFLPAMLGPPEEDLLGLRTLRPGPWAGAAAGLASILGGILHAAGPAWRSTFQPPRWLVDVQFYSSALGAIAVFFALMMSAWQTGAAESAGEGLIGADERVGPYRSLATVGGALMLASIALFLVNATLAVRNHRAVRPRGAPTAPRAADG